MSSGLPVRKIETNVDTKEFWDATALGKLLLRSCNDCLTPIWYPRPYCPVCQSMNTSWIESSGKGVVYSYSITRKGQGVWADKAPYIVAYVELEEGPRVLTNVVAPNVDDVHIGMHVQVIFDDTGEGLSIYRFAPS